MRQRGSVTLFAIMSMMLIASVLLTLLEGARAIEIRRLSELQTEKALESVFANYNAALWKECSLLGSDQTKLEQILRTSANGKWDSKETDLNTYVFQVDTLEVKSYTLLSDGDGKVYAAAVSEYMKDNILYESAKQLYSHYMAMKSLEETSGFDFSILEKALKGIKEAQKESAKKEEKVKAIRAGKQPEKNPIEVIAELVDTGILSLMVKDIEKLSDSEINLKDTISKRALLKGKNSEIPQTDWLDRVLLQQYLLTYLSNYEKAEGENALSYEVEYLIGGKASDKGNLRAVAERLLSLRASSNLVYLLSDKAKIAEANAIALAIAGVSANPVLVNVVKLAILTAWAYAEGVLDVRAILIGKKIPLLKSKDTWTLELKNIGKITEGFWTAKESELGVGYEGYLGILILFKAEKELGMRAMDMQEFRVRQINGYEGFQMDQQVVNVKAKITYKYAPIFSDLKKLGQWNYKVSTEASYGYYK